jgi:aldose 1-epimerase
MSSQHRWSFFLVGVLFMTSAAARAAQISGPEPFGKTSDGTSVERYELKAGNITVKLITRGATITELHIPDRNGRTADVVLGFDDLAGYESDANQYFGCTTGRVCNRIGKGRFTLDGTTYELARNNGDNHLHGGVKRSLDKVVWKAEPTTTQHGPGLKFSYVSPEGEEGYPGTVTFATTYVLTEAGKLVIEWHAQTNRATPVNLTNHSYFNLAGAGAATVLDHELTLGADRYTPVDDTLIPTGKIDPVAGTPLDFTKPTRIGDRIESLVAGPTLGYDHNFVLTDGAKTAAAVRPGELRFAAKLRDPASGRTLTIETTQPAVQFYSGNFLKGQTGKGGKSYALRSACCLETQHFPDSVNHPEFPSIILQPGQEYRQSCVYGFSVE